MYKMMMTGISIEFLTGVCQVSPYCTSCLLLGKRVALRRHININIESCSEKESLWFSSQALQPEFYIIECETCAHMVELILFEYKKIPSEMEEAPRNTLFTLFRDVPINFQIMQYADYLT